MRGVPTTPEAALAEGWYRPNTNGGLCHCGCGDPAPIATQTNRRWGYVKDQPMRFRLAHSLRVHKDRGRRNRTHGHTAGGRTPTYLSWMAMKARCLNPNHMHYDRYGGSGITICDRWLNSYPAFLEDMGERPEGLSIDRYPDPYGDYEPENCRWATAKEQAANWRERDAA